jgi:hypothetical protein
LIDLVYYFFGRHGGGERVWHRRRSTPVG